jgi:zinc and cadmium transporter
MTNLSSTWVYAIVSVVVVSLLSLVGVACISISEQRLKRIIFTMVSLAVGAMFGDAFIHLLPESFENPRSKVETSLYVLAGIFAFFILEKFLLWRHQHTLESDSHIHHVGYMNLIADGLHNLIDGMIIGASYLISTPVGIATTMAVVFHEIPHELGNFFCFTARWIHQDKSAVFQPPVSNLRHSGSNHLPGGWLKRGKLLGGDVTACSRRLHLHRGI